MFSGKWGMGEMDSYGYPLKKGFDYYIGQTDQNFCHDMYPPYLNNQTWITNVTQVSLH